ncbi:39S ribosomal protein L22, mitochondrial, partial [Fragariocoptes setiger]
APIWVGSYRIRNVDEFRDTFPKPKRWPRKNEIFEPPQTDPNEPRRPATFHYYRANIKYSPKKMWYIVKFIRGMSIDEAIKQLSFIEKKGALIAKECLLDAQQQAVKKHHFEYKSNMWIEEALCTKGLVVKGLRKHARMRFGIINYFYVHLQLKLTEGLPPKDYYLPEKDGNDLLKDYYKELRDRKLLLTP